MREITEERNKNIETSREQIEERSRKRARDEENSQRERSVERGREQENDQTTATREPEEDRKDNAWEIPLEGETRKVADVDRIRIATSTTTSVLKAGLKMLPSFWTKGLVIDDVALIKGYYYTVMNSSPITIQPAIREEIQIGTKY